MRRLFRNDDEIWDAGLGCDWGRRGKGGGTGLITTTFHDGSPAACLAFRMDFEWDTQKADANLIEHRVTFTEARLDIDDPLGWFRMDGQHSTS